MIEMKSLLIAIFISFPQKNVMIIPRKPYKKSWKAWWRFLFCFEVKLDGGW